MDDQNLLQEISNKLSVLISLELQKDGAGGVQEHVERLSRLGLSGNEIAAILGTTPGTVAVAKNRIKKRRK
ncbi:MAG: hypothetical protein ACREIJ_01345 [Nitrospiraceae bacterium]